MFPTDKDLQTIRAACLAVANQRSSNKDILSPLAGCCGAVTHMLHGMFGGYVLEGEIDGAPHYWNRFPDGRVVDLTSCQFGGDGFHALIEGKELDADKLPDLIPLEFLLFAQLVSKQLHSPVV